MNKKLELILPTGWKYYTAFKGSGRGERYCYVFKNAELKAYRSFSTSWTIQSKQDAFAAFWEWYNDLFGEKK
jgi:hypothetical protein